MLQGQVGQAHLRAILEKHLVDYGIDPYDKEMSSFVHASAAALQEILREYTVSVIKKELGVPTL